jgi:hypothetical protein
MSIRIIHDNLVAIAYKTGYCGSLIYALSSLSPEVQPYRPFDQLLFADGTAHEAQEKWFNNLHDYSDSLTVSEDKWQSYVPKSTKQALEKNKKLVLFRCHPNIACKLSFIENLKVLYVTHKNKYVTERWAYEKIYKPHGDAWYQRNLSQLLGAPSTVKIDNRIKRKLLINNFNHNVVTWSDVLEKMQLTPYCVNVDQLLEKKFDSYTNMCVYLNITPISENKFTELIDKYNSKQWTRF